MTPSEKVAHDIARALADQQEIDRRNPAPSGPSPFHGAGIGKLGDYAIAAAMVGAIIGAITGGVGGAIVWAILLGGLFRLPGILFGSESVNRAALLKGIVVGGLAGALFGLLFSLFRDVVLGVDVPADKAGNAIVNFAFLGAVIFGVYRTRRG